LIVRLWLWNVGDSKTTIDELRGQLPRVDPPSVWIANQAGERFGLVLFGDPPEGLQRVEELIGRAADAAEFEEL
jgi:hypothetical protein